MPIYGFKPNPKQQVINKAKRLFGEDAKVEVTGTRPSPLDCKRLSIPTGVYYVECIVNGDHVASTHMRDWRKAYNQLVLAVEKAYEEALYRTESV